MSDTQPPREFELIGDLAEGLKLVKEGAKTLSSAMVWTKNQEQVINSHMVVYSEAGQCFYCWKPKDLDPQKFMDELAKIQENECFFSVSLLRANIFFKAKFLGFDSSGLQFKLPAKVYKVQRRKDLRFPVPESHSFKVSFKDPQAPQAFMTKTVLDLSASGLAFHISDEEASLFPAQLVLQELTLNIRKRKITVSAEIRHLRKINADSRFKGFAVGVVFKDIRPGDSQHIAGFVFEESRKYFSRFI